MQIKLPVTAAGLQYWMRELDGHSVFLAFVLPWSNKWSCLLVAMTLTAIQSQPDIFPMAAPLLLLHELGGSEGCNTLCPEVLLTFENNAFIRLLVSWGTTGAAETLRNHRTQPTHPFSKKSFPVPADILVSGKAVSIQVKECTAFREGEYRY